MFPCTIDVDANETIVASEQERGVYTLDTEYVGDSDYFNDDPIPGLDEEASE